MVYPLRLYSMYTHVWTCSLLIDLCAYFCLELFCHTISMLSVLASWLLDWERPVTRFQRTPPEAQL